MKEGLLTCKNILPANVIETISRQLHLRFASCALSELGLIEEIHGMNYHFMGGEEFYTLRAAQSAKKLEKIFFIGIMPDNYRSYEAYSYFQERGVEIVPTGGGQAAVVQSILDIFNTDFLMVPLLARNFKWATGDPSLWKQHLKTLDFVVIGAGNIGISLLDKTHGLFGNSYYGSGRSKKEVLEKLGISWVRDMKEAFSLGKIVSINLAYGPETHHCIRYEHLAEMPKKSLLINSARADLIEPLGFLQFLKDRPDVRVITDVHYVEGDSFEKLEHGHAGIANTYREIVDCPNIDFLEHSFATRHPEIAVPEYGENLLRVLRKQAIIK